MRRFASIHAACLSFALVLAGSACSRTDTGTTTESRLSDADIERNIKDRFNNDPQLAAADLDISVDADNNHVKLSGTVESQDLRSRAVDLARASHPGLVVEDTIDVEPRELSRAEYTDEIANEQRTRAREAGDKVGNSVDDAWIHMKLSSKLIGNSDTPHRNINVDVVNGTVTLRGTVDTAEARTEAERVAKETEGVTRVNNALKVGGADRNNDRNRSR